MTTLPSRYFLRLARQRAEELIAALARAGVDVSHISIVRTGPQPMSTRDFTQLMVAADIKHGTFDMVLDWWLNGYTHHALRAVARHTRRLDIKTKRVLLDCPRGPLTHITPQYAQKETTNGR